MTAQESIQIIMQPAAAVESCINYKGLFINVLTNYVFINISEAIIIHSLYMNITNFAVAQRINHVLHYLCPSLVHKSTLRACTCRTYPLLKFSAAGFNCKQAVYICNIQQIFIPVFTSLNFNAVNCGNNISRLNFILSLIRNSARNNCANLNAGTSISFII